MPGGHLNTVLTHIRQWIGTPATDELSDGQLLERFLAQRDQTAFAAIVERHGAMVQGVCRRVLHDAHEADDAFQATFLVLVRKAKSIVRQESLGSWLYGVAYRVSLRARAQADRRQVHCAEVEDVPATETNGDGWSDLRPVLDEEVSRLPEKYRQPVVLCYLEGKPYEEAARQLGWPAGTVAGRLARARDLLRKRLTRRGVALASSFPAALLADQRVSAQLLENTVRAAYHYAAGPAAAAGSVPAPVAALAEGTVHAMFVHKLKIVAVALFGVLLLGAGAAAYTPRDRRDESADKPAAAIVADAAPGRVAVKDGILPKGNRESEVVAVQFARDAGTVIVARGGSVVVYDTGTHEVRSELLSDAQASFGRMTLSADGQLALIGPPHWRNGSVKLVDLATKKELGTLEGAPHYVMGLQIAPDNKTVACAGYWRDEKTSEIKRTAVQLYEVGTRKLRKTLEGAGSGGIAYSPDGTLLAAVVRKVKNEAGFVRIYDAGTGDIVATLCESKNHREGPIAFSPDSKKLLLSPAGGIELWDIATRKCDWINKPLEDKKFFGPTTLAFSPDGKRIATGDGEGVARIWDAVTGEERESCKTTEAYVTCVAFAPDGRSLVVGSGHFFPTCGTKLKFDGYPCRVWALKK
ncbi:MAG: sigma-70 family RNA polymerase sigma factor [Gemmataceae bacterium]|nr:sigma-70 family RNA polymerase sigma factor [Gemmataceae bacterium]